MSPTRVYAEKSIFSNGLEEGRGFQMSVVEEDAKILPDQNDETNLDIPNTEGKGIFSKLPVKRGEGR